VISAFDIDTVGALWYAHGMTSENSTTKRALVQARVTEEDKQAIEEQAGELGLSVSEFLRLLARTYTVTLIKRSQ